MAIGIIMKGLNALYKNSSLDYFFEFVPQFIFLMCIFGYMDLLIIVKWLTDWTGNEGSAPSIIT
jgi:V-type H+-transporting ATPase subunit a